MENFLKRALRKFRATHNSIEKEIALPGDEYATKSYSQEGEDILLTRLLEDKITGFYIDIGAHHPFRFSNTFLFYQKGWRGINIDAMPGSMQAFNEQRPLDINLEIPISGKKQLLEYYIFNEPALNTFSKSEAEKKDGLRNYKIVKRKELETFPLSEILGKYLPEGQSIDFLSIDVEGLDFDVLQSNDWTKFRPGIILIETLRTDVENAILTPVNAYLKQRGYSLVSKTFNTLFFKKS